MAVSKEIDHYKLYKGSVFRIVLFPAPSYQLQERTHVIYCIILCAVRDNGAEVAEGNFNNTNIPWPKQKIPLHDVFNSPKIG